MPRIQKINQPRDNRWMILVSLCLAVLIAQIDTSVVNIATYPIGVYFQASIQSLQWMVDVYNIIYAIALLTGGLLADLYGRRLIFIIGVLIFSVASLGCALAYSIELLIIFRALTGLGAALLIPASLAIIRVVWQDPLKRGVALGVWAGCNGIALAIAPTLGGVLVKNLGWQSIFFIAIPLCMVSLALASIFMPESSEPKNRHIDLKGQTLGVLSLGGLAFFAIEMYTSTIVATFALIISLISIFLFIRTEKDKGDHALIPMSIFNSSQFNSSLICSAAMTFGMYGVLFLLPLFWQTEGLFNEIGSGIALLPMALAFIIFSPFSSTLEKKLGLNTVVCGGVSIIGLGLLIIGVFSPYIYITCIGLAMTGVGMGCAAAPMMHLAISSVHSNRAGTSSSLVNVARMTGATMGIAILGTVSDIAGGGRTGLLYALIVAAVVQISCSVLTLKKLTRPLLNKGT